MTTPDYTSTQTRPIPPDLSMPELYSRMTANPPAWINLAMRIRDGLGRLGGLRPIHGFAGDATLVVGGTADFFTVDLVSDACIAMSAADHHLRVEATLTRIDDNAHLNTNVYVHNWVGRLYMLPVGLAHPLVCNAMLDRALRT